MSSKTWQVGVLGVALIGVGAYAFIQHGDVTDLTAQVAAAKEDSAHAHEALATLSARVAAIANAAEQAHGAAAANEAQATAEHEQLESSQAQVAMEHERLEKAEAKLGAETRPDLPVTLTFRKSVLSTGLVAMFRNTSGNALEFSLDLESPATGRHVRRSMVLDPNGMLEMGVHQGWAFAPGQRITLDNPDYRPLLRTVGG